MMNNEEQFKEKMQELIEKYNNINIERIENEEGYIKCVSISSLTDEEKRIKHNEYMKQYFKRPVAKAKHNEYMKQYFKRPVARAKRNTYAKEYFQRPEVKLKQREYNKRYLANNPQALIKGRKATREYYDKYRRYMKSIPLMPNIFPDEVMVEYHHLLNDYHSKSKYCWFIIPLPKVTHNYIAGGVKGKLHWKHNAKWIEIIFGINVKQFLLGI